ncbi:MAG: Rrf2 family transcriptional regulator, partial [Clostridiales bacterium]
NGIVKSVRGAHGGYYLNKEISQITVGQILRILEGSFAPVECVSDDDKKICCENESKCLTKSVWGKIKNSIESVVDSITIQDLIEDYHDFEKNDNFMYYI